MTEYAKDIIVVHSLSGNQVAVRSSKILTVTQWIGDNYCRIFLDNDPEPMVVQESWEEVMYKWTGNTRYDNEDILPNLLKESEENLEEE